MRLVAAQAPGSSNDATARAVAEYMTSSLGPAGLPADVVRRVADACRESASRSEAVKNVLAQLGVEEAPLTGAELQRFIQRTWPTYQAMTRELGLQAQ